jgi:ferrochelatase
MKSGSMAPESSSVRQPSFAVLLAAYGSPRNPDDIPGYLRDVRGGRPTPPGVVDELRHRYAAIGGASPLLERSQDQARGLASRLARGTPVYLGMRHWHPYIAEVMAEIRGEGHNRIVAVPLAPHFSRLSIGAYAAAIDRARESAEVRLVRAWFDHPQFLEAVAARIREALERFPANLRDDVAIVFTAHSLPRRILAEQDPYPDQLQASMDGVLSRLGNHTATLAYQSAGRTDEPWLGPDAADTLRELAARGIRQVLICPIGFVSDHLEVLYDIDIELQALAGTLGIRLERTESLNDHPLLLEALASRVREAAREAGWA